jgi:hypothetical protein
MKKLFTVLVVLSLFSCTKKTEEVGPQITLVSVIRDMTDPLNEPPQIQPVLGLYEFDKYPNQEAFFRLRLITDMQMNPQLQISINDEKTSEASNKSGDPNHRTKTIKQFYRNVVGCTRKLTERFDTVKTLSESECFSTISSELRVLKNREASKKYLLVYSDLREKSIAYNSYVPENMELLRKNPEFVERKLNERSPLPRNLCGITVYFCYRPPNKQADNDFMTWVSFYTRALEKRGAKVYIQAQADSFDF